MLTSRGYRDININLKLHKKKNNKSIRNDHTIIKAISKKKQKFKYADRYKTYKPDNIINKKKTITKF